MTSVPAVCKPEYALFNIIERYFSYLVDLKICPLGLYLGSGVTCFCINTPFITILPTFLP